MKLIILAGAAGLFYAGVRHGTKIPDVKNFNLQSGDYAGSTLYCLSESSLKEMGIKKPQCFDGNDLQQYMSKLKSQIEQKQGLNPDTILALAFAKEAEYSFQKSTKAKQHDQYLKIIDGTLLTVAGLGVAATAAITYAVVQVMNDK